MPHLLIDSVHAACAPHVLPRGWLAGFDLSVYAPGDPAQVLAGPADLGSADALMLRSVTRVTAAQVAQARRLSAVATCSSGTDHIDLSALSPAGISAFSGRGGNAIAVAEWVAWALARQWRCDLRAPAPWRGRRIIVVGVGAVGGCVSALAAQLGATVVKVDPPRATRDPAFAADPTQMTLTRALAEPCDALTLHVPLVPDGAYPTVGLIGAAELGRLAGACVLNAARGGVLDEPTAAAARRAGALSGLWCDTFLNEPRPDPSFVDACDGATPHIAGHSIAGKLKVAWLPMMALRAHFDLPAALDLAAAVTAARGDEAPFDHVLDGTSAAMAGLAGADFRPLRAAHRRQEGGLLTGGAASAALLEAGCPRLLAVASKSL